MCVYYLFGGWGEGATFVVTANVGVGVGGVGFGGWEGEVAGCAFIFVGGVARIGIIFVDDGTSCYIIICILFGIGILLFWRGWWRWRWML